MKRITRILATVALLTLLAAASVGAEPVGTGFSYQGKIDKDGAPYTGSCSLYLRLFDAATNGTQIGSFVELMNVTVTDGLFTVVPDFGAGIFTGEARWLDIQVQTAGDAGYTQLSPRQRITAAPYSLFSSAGAGGGSQWITNGSSIYYDAGKVGIGVANPTTKLHVASGSENINTAYFESNNAAYPCFFTRNWAPNGWGWFDDASARHFLWGTLGIGTTTPEAKLHVIGAKWGIKAIGYGGAGSPVGTGVWGVGDGGPFTGPAVGVYGESDYGDGVQGVTSSSVWYGGYFRNTGGGTALYADGLAQVKTLQILGGADIVEGFETGDGPIEAGTVLVIDEEHPGELRASRQSYDHRVAGVVSGAGGISPGLRLGQEGVLDGETPVAMSGRVYVHCSAENGSIRPGDLLTTASTEGHAMRADDARRSHGAVLGKAMTSLEEGTGLVLVLVNLQ